MSSSTYYSVEEDVIIREHYPHMPTSELQKVFLPNRSIRGIRLRAWRLGAQKEPEAREFSNSVVSTLTHLSENERHYLAGVFDGEGCIHMGMTKNGICRFYASITTTSPNLLQWLNDHLLVGTAYIAEHPSNRPHWKRRWDWIVSGNRRVIIFCKEIAPYLVIKKRQAELVSQGYVRLNREDRLKLQMTLRSMKDVD